MRRQFVELDLGEGRRVQAVQTTAGVYHAVSSDGGRTWWGHGTNVDETLDQFVKRYQTHTCSTCGTSVVEDDVCWSMATPVCSTCWLADQV